MSGGIFLLQDNEQLVEMKAQVYDSEDLLQSILAKYPNLLAGDQINVSNPRRWILITREMAIPSDENGGGRWSIDHLFIDQDGIPTLVEVKRSSDTRIRREVIGQMLEYAANAVLYWPVEEVRAKFETKFKTDELDATYLDFLDDNITVEDFWQNVKSNLERGKIRLLFVADELPSELRKIIEFLNQQMSPAEVLGIEIKQFVGEKLKTLVPRVIGQTEVTQRKKSNSNAPNKKWDEQTFFEELIKTNNSDDIAVAKKILNWSTQSGMRIWWGRGKISGSFVPTLDHNNRNNALFAVWTFGMIELYFTSHSNKPPFDKEEKRRELLNKLNNISTIELSDDSFNRLPKIPLSALKREEDLNAFLSIYEWFAEEIKSH